MLHYYFILLFLLFNFYRCQESGTINNSLEKNKSKLWIHYKLQLRVLDVQWDKPKSISLQTHSLFPLSSSPPPKRKGSGIFSVKIKRFLRDLVRLLADQYGDRWTFTWHHSCWTCYIWVVAWVSDWSIPMLCFWSNIYQFVHLEFGKLFWWLQEHKKGGGSIWS